MAACAKIAHQNEASARRALSKIRRKNAGRGRTVPTGIYWCGDCRAWHLTSKSPSRPAPWRTRKA